LHVSVSTKITVFFRFSSHDTNMIFEKVSITGNFTDNPQYPIALTGNHTIDKLTFSSSFDGVKRVALEVENVKNVVALGIFGRDFAKDSLSPATPKKSDFYGYIFNEDVQEFFDYVWIRLRVMIFIVSIYVLEMM
jgi:hypothetical protein